MFFATSLLMSILAGWSRAPHSILERGAGTPPAPTAPAPINSGNILDQLKQLQGPSNPPAAPAPAAPEQKP
jgi:preprotein translocase subunit SecG